MKRLLLVGAIAVAGSLMLASAAAITFDGGTGGNVGAGAAAVDGFAVSNVVYDLDNTDPSLVAGVSLTIAPAASEVAVSVDAATTWDSCAPVGPLPAADWTCDINPDVPAVGVTQLDVAAGS